MRRLPRPPRGPPGLGPPGPGPLRNIRGPPPPHIGPRGPGLGIPPLPAMTPPRMPGSVSSCTNSNDPVSMDSRLFVGNLNTVALSKEDVESIFSQYGIVSGISLHKGFAFVQFRHPDDARFAGSSEDGKMYAGQAIDINIVSQPKNRSALKRSNSGKGVNDSPTKKTRQDSSGTNQSLQRTLVTLSSSCVESNGKKSLPSDTNDLLKTADSKNTSRPTNTVIKASPAISKSESVPKSTLSSNSTLTVPLKVASRTDILICGVCKLQFSNLHSLTKHKQNPCRLRFSCECNSSGDSLLEPIVLQCASCDIEFVSAWELCQHCTQEHQMSIYKMEVAKENEIGDGEQDIKVETN